MLRSTTSVIVPRKIAIIAALETELHPLIRSWPSTTDREHTFHESPYAIAVAAASAPNPPVAPPKPSSRNIPQNSLSPPESPASLAADLKVGETIFPATVIDSQDGSRHETSIPQRPSRQHRRRTHHPRHLSRSRHRRSKAATGKILRRPRRGHGSRRRRSRCPKTQSPVHCRQSHLRRRQFRNPRNVPLHPRRQSSTPPASSSTSPSAPGSGSASSASPATPRSPRKISAPGCAKAP